MEGRWAGGFVGGRVGWRLGRRVGGRLEGWRVLWEGGLESKVLRSAAEPSLITAAERSSQGYALFSTASPVMCRGVVQAGWARLIPVLFRRVNISDHEH